MNAYTHMYCKQYCKVSGRFVLALLRNQTVNKIA